MRWPTCTATARRPSCAAPISTRSPARCASPTSRTTARDGALYADTSDLRLIGDVALRAGLPIYELKGATTDLEALFFELTEGTNRNLGSTAGSPGLQAPATEEGTTR